MEKDDSKIEIEWLEDFSVENSNDISFDLYKNFADSEESLKKILRSFFRFLLYYLYSI